MTKKQPSTDTNVTWEVITQEDPETGDLILPIPTELMERMGWKIDDVLDFDQDDTGRWVISKK